jgi:hypothetical protein
MNDPRDPRLTYADALSQAADDADDALAAIRDQQREGKITTAEAAAERIGLLERHLARLHDLRVEYLGGEQ